MLCFGLLVCAFAAMGRPLRAPGAAVATGSFTLIPFDNYWGHMSGEATVLYRLRYVSPSLYAFDCKILSNSTFDYDPYVGEVSPLWVLELASSQPVPELVAIPAQQGEMSLNLIDRDDDHDDVSQIITNSPASWRIANGTFFITIGGGLADPEAILDIRIELAFVNVMDTFVNNDFTIVLNTESF